MNRAPATKDSRMTRSFFRFAFRVVLGISVSIPLWWFIVALSGWPLGETHPLLLAAAWLPALASVLWGLYGWGARISRRAGADFEPTAIEDRDGRRG